MRLLARNTADSEIAARGKRRHRSKEERRRIVEESLVPGASVAVIARSHGVNANQVFHWRKLYCEGRLNAGPSPLLPVRLAEVFEAPHTPTAPQAGTIHIELGRAPGVDRLSKENGRIFLTTRAADHNSSDTAISTAHIREKILDPTFRDLNGGVGALSLLLAEKNFGPGVSQPRRASVYPAA